MFRVVGLVALLVFCIGCVFDSSGAPVQPPDGQLVSDHLIVDSTVVSTDLVGVDHISAHDRLVLEDSLFDTGTTPPTDTGVLDQPVAVVDQAVPADKGVVVKPISPTALGQAWYAATVPCVDANGVSDGTMIKVADSASVGFMVGSAALTGASAATLAWVGGKPVVSIGWNPNACGPYEFTPTDVEFSSAGMLVRGAQLDTNGDILLSVGTTTADLNFVNATSNGTFQNELFLPDDSELVQYPHLVNPVNKAKQIIIQLGLP